MDEAVDVDEEIRRILDEHGRLPGPASDLSDDDDLYQAGLTSHSTVNLMLAIEAAFDIEFPQSMLQKKTFTSIATIRRSLEEVLAEQQ